MKRQNMKSPSATPVSERRTEGVVARTSFPVVGIGASAGGLEAFSHLLDELPSDTGMAFVLVQHLDPTHSSFLADALKRTTRMPVTQANDGERVQPNHVYVIPPNAEIGIVDGALTLTPREEGRRVHLPIDAFFRSLAQERGHQALGVVLSGTASDGTEGLRAIKDEDGITLAQDPKTAKFDGMPRSAVDAGVVDYCLAIPDLAREIVRLSRREFLPEGIQSDATTLSKIFALLRNGVGVDFSEYKAPTFERRLGRRMALRRVESPKKYLELLQADPREVRALYEETLIHVTSFFRDPEVFDHLKTDVFPQMLRNKSPGDPLRLWVAGCSTGEEVYSLAISLLEFLGDSPTPHPIQIFGSDISEIAIDKARQGVFSDVAMKGVGDERRRRYFTKVEGGYRINKMVRDLCVFARHDLGKDPPFSRLDLVSCRNVLIYFGPVLQKRVVPVLHYALNPGGFLLLGRTETISGFGRLFSPAGKSNKVFTRTSATSDLRFSPRPEMHPVAPGARRGPAEGPRRSVDLARHLDRLLLARYSPPAVLINERMEILQFRGETGAFLRPAPGEPQNNVIKMARAGLVVALRAALSRVKREMTSVRTRGVEVSHSESSKSCDLVVIPLAGIPDTKESLFVVLFEEVRAAPKASRRKSGRGSGAVKKSSRVLKLEHELAATEDYLQSMIDDQDRTNDDLNSANEELVSGNEELQSMNEELETAKEELQSTNEELVTVNDELHNRNQEAAEINSDLVNLLSTVDVPILILDANRCIRRFNPKARSILNIVPSDIGRPLEDFKSNLQVPDLDKRIADVIETNTMHESEVQGSSGCWYRMQIRPYKTIDNRIDGATLSLVDIDALKHHVRVAEKAKADAERANSAKDEFLAVLSHEIRTPLSSMLMQAQMLRRGAIDEAKVKRAGAVIERGTRMQVQLIDDLLDVSRIVTGKLRIELTPVDLALVIKSALESVDEPAARKSVKLHFSIDETVGPVLGDASRLQQVVANLLSNAIKFSAENSEVTGVLDRADGHARIRISDTGSGIEPGFLPHIFNRFAQEDGSTVRLHGGLGLGLAIVRHLVEAHGGTVAAESAGRGRGAAFSVLLPLTESSATAQKRDPDHLADSRKDEIRFSAGPGALKDLRILVVDDDLATRDVVAMVLEELGAEVRVAGSAREALASVEEFRPRLLLCDIAMPGEDGYSLLRKIRDLDAAKGGVGIRALALTAFAGEHDRRRALSAGFQMHVAKPVDISRLTQAVTELSQQAVEQVGA